MFGIDYNTKFPTLTLDWSPLRVDWFHNRWNPFSTMSHWRQVEYSTTQITQIRYLTGWRLKQRPMTLGNSVTRVIHENSRKCMIYHTSKTRDKICIFRKTHEIRDSCNARCCRPAQDDTLFNRFQCARPMLIFAGRASASLIFSNIG